MQVVPRLQYNIIGLFCLFRDFWNKMGTVAAEKKSRGEDVPEFLRKKGILMTDASQSWLCRNLFPSLERIDSVKGSLHYGQSCIPP
jgi:hypothetical protein